MGQTSLNPVRALLLGLPISLFLGALLSDIAYYRTYELQWANFAAWLIAGALLLSVIFLVVALIDLVRRRSDGHPRLMFILVAAMWILGFFNALVHARDGWASMPTGLILSVIVTLLALAAAWAGLFGTHRVEAN